MTQTANPELDRRNMFTAMASQRADGRPRVRCTFCGGDGINNDTGQACPKCRADGFIDAEDR